MALVLHMPVDDVSCRVGAAAGQHLQCTPLQVAFGSAALNGATK